jgi:hypothetical protein
LPGVGQQPYRPRGGPTNVSKENERPCAATMGESAGPATVSLRIRFMDSRETVISVAPNASIADLAEKVHPK